MEKTITILVFLLISIFNLSCDKEDASYFECPEAEPFCFEQEGLLWSGIVESRMDMEQATEYCKDMGGRLPKISELRKLIIKCDNTKTSGACGVKESCLEIECWNPECSGCKWSDSGRYSVFKDTDCFWSSSFDKNDPDYGWGICFGNSYIVSHDKTDLNHVRCVSL